jgi:hypothetical protein
MLPGSGHAPIHAGSEVKEGTRKASVTITFFEGSDHIQYSVQCSTEK